MNGNKNGVRSEVLRASQLQKLIERLADIRDPKRQKEYRKEVADHKRNIAGYKKALKKHPEQTGTETSLFGKRDVKGFGDMVHGREVFFERPSKKDAPKPPEAMSYSYYGYYRGLIKAHAEGLLVDSLFNRDIKPERVEQFRTAMQEGKWQDLLSDPITVTKGGQIVNGQHRLAAATRVNWKKVPHDPVFLVVWGVNPQEALFADGSHRTARDEQTIATKLLEKKSETPTP